MASQQRYLSLALHPNLNMGAQQPFLQLKAEKFPNKTLESFERPTSVGPLQAVRYDI